MALNIELNFANFMALVSCHDRFSLNAWASLYEHFDSTLEDGAILNVATLLHVYHEINEHTLIEMYGDEHPELKYLDHDEKVEYAKTIDGVIQVRDIVDSGDSTETEIWLVPFGKVFGEAIVNEIKRTA